MGVTPRSENIIFEDFLCLNNYWCAKYILKNKFVYIEIVFYEILMETRAGKYGRFLAEFVLSYVRGLPERVRGDYERRFLVEFNNYSDVPRKEGEPVNAGCVYELLNMGSFDSGNPEQLARVMKEGLHLMYQKQTSRRCREGFLERFELRSKKE